MSAVRRALMWALFTAVATTVALIASAPTEGNGRTTTSTTWFSGPGDLTEVRP